MSVSDIPERRVISDGAPKSGPVIVFSEDGKSARTAWHPYDNYWIDRSGAPGGPLERVPFRPTSWRHLTAEERQDLDADRPYRQAGR